ncbi:CHAT domain-containing protein [Actinomadura rubrisoli]|uniref:CHAT domain-containing protein n=1 Tax=Actinomadura rubrisoli TaxID=2530368 RepID=A0A4R5BK89_9ACTN|nr:CHAT domain-containing protein [Actinomadura rubrisoli]TDD85400.1 CHAT domain-containing protein [Actinomadura rubrisoli]
MFTGDSDLSYAGCVVAREFDRGDDAAWAVRGLGYPPSTLPASRVLIVWEQADLLISLDAPDLVEGRALMFLDAAVDDYSVTRYPFEVMTGSGSSSDIRWGEPHTAERPALPGLIIEVLDIWRDFLPDDFVATVEELEEGGYTYVPAGRNDSQFSSENVHHIVGAALASGEPEAVERACRALREVLAAMPEHDPRRGLYLVDFSLVLQLRYENNGDLNDVRKAVRAAHDAAPFPDGGMPAKRLNVLGTALRTWYEQTGEPAALSEAITVGRQAVDVIPDGDPNHGTCLANLAWALHASFLADGAAGSLAAALSASRRAFDALDVLDPRREVVAMSMGVMLQSEYSRTGDLAVLNEAIELGRSATANTTSSGWMLAARLTNLGRALEARYWRTGELESLREAARTERRALAVAPLDHADRTIYQLNLSGTLRALFDRTGDEAALDEAFAVARDAVKDVPAGHPFRINHLANLSLLHQMRYALTSNAAELDAAQTLLREALAEAPATHPHRPTVLSVLGEVLDARSSHTAEFGQLEEAVELVRDALDSVAHDDPRRGTFLRTLAEIHRSRHEGLGDQAALSEAIELFRIAAADPTSSVRGRVDAARRWGDIAAAAGRTGLALDGYATAVELLPLLAARTLHRHDSEYWLGRYGGLASDAAALAVEMNSPDRALELLELGRTVLMAQALDVRTDMSALRDRDPQLADRFEWLSTRLENDDGEQPDGRRKLADELESVIATVRALPGMDRFLLPPRAAELLVHAGQGPIVVVNVSAYRSDALILTGSGLRLRSLPQLTPATVGGYVNRFLTALATDCRSRFRNVHERGERTLSEVLSWVWENVCVPVLDIADPAPDQRMWWIPTGLLGFLPLHAAGDEATGESMLVRAVCSYTPSIRALAHARTMAGGRPSTRTLVVGMPETPNADAIHKAFRESSFVAERAPDPHVLIGPEATSETVTAALQHSAWAHFACHAVTAASPSNSHLQLHDHERRPLTAAAISRLRLDSAALAYLSACHTAVSTTGLADEVIHIASAFHLAGYPQVIGTLWAVDDDAATAIAELVYTELTCGHPDPRRAPAALRDALSGMRRKHPRQPSLWASHIHIGI